MILSFVYEGEGRQAVFVEQPYVRAAPIRPQVAHAAYFFVRGWRADKPVFSEGYGSDAVYSYTLDAGFDVGFNVKEEFDLWVVVKKVMNVSYQAVDEQGGSLMFTSTVSGSRDVLEDSTLAENISETKLSQLQSVTCTDPTKEFMYWAVLVDGKYVRFDIENDPLLASYITSGSRIILYAVFGDKEVSV